MYPGGHCALFTAGMGAAAAGVSTISVARVATGFMSLHSARVISLRPLCAFREPGLAPQSTRSRLRLRRRASNLEGTFQGLHKQMPPGPAVVFGPGALLALLLPACERSPVSRGKELGVPLAFGQRTVSGCRSLRSSAKHLVSMEQKSCWNVFYRTNFMGSGASARRRADCSTGTRSACSNGRRGRTGASACRPFRLFNTRDGSLRFILRNRRNRRRPKKFLSSAQHHYQAMFNTQSGNTFVYNTLLESSLPLRLAKLATEVEQQNVAEGGYAST